MTSLDHQPVPSVGIGQIAARGMAWTYLSFAAGKLLLFVSTVVLARLLIPSEFGQVAFALLVIGYLETVGDFGISSALIYEKDRPLEAANVAFIVSIVAGLTWFVIAFFAAPLCAEFFKDPLVTPIMRAMSLSFVINGFGNTHDAILRRDLAFKRRMLPDFIMAIFKGAISVALALAGWGVWSLVWGQLIGAAASTIALWLVVPWRPNLRASWDATRAMLKYGGHIVSVNVISAIVHDADFLIVGRMLGATALGFYSLAYRTPEMLITTVIWVIGKVTFPVYAKLRDEPVALAQAFLLTLRYLSLVTLPAGLGLAFVGNQFVLSLYGQPWAPAAATMQVLAISGALRSLGSHAGDVYKATGRPQVLTKLGILRAAVLIPAMIWGARFGIFGVAVAQAIVTAASTALNLVIAGRILDLPIRALIGQFKTAAVASAAMIAALVLIQPVLAGISDALELPFEVCLGMVVYVATVAAVDMPSLRRVRAAFVTAEGSA